MSYTDEYTRVYRAWGHLAHLLPPSEEYPESLCGIRSTLGRTWFGTGNQDEYDRAAALQLCGKCEAAAKGART